MADKDSGSASAEATWLPVIGKALAYLCMKAADADGTFNNLLDRVNFVENFGLPSADAAKAAGSTKASVDVLRRRARKKKAGKNAKAKKKQGRGY